MPGRDSILYAAWRLNPKWPLLIGAFLLADLLLFGLMQFMVVPEIEALEREYLGRQAEARRVLRRGAETTTPRELFRRGREDLATFRQEIPPKGAFTELIAELFAMADKTGLDIASVSYQPEEIAQRQLLRYSLSFSVAGEYRQLKRFIALLEQSARLIAIDQVTLSGAESEEHGVSLRMRLSTYFRAEEP